jgi:hypothetical protein
MIFLRFPSAAYGLSGVRKQWYRKNKATIVVFIFWFAPKIFLKDLFAPHLRAVARKA